MLCGNEFEHAVPNPACLTRLFPNDAWFVQKMGHVTRSGFLPGVIGEKGIPGADIHATEAWGVHADASSILVAVVTPGSGDTLIWQTTSGAIPARYLITALMTMRTGS